MSLKDIKSLISGGTILIAVALYLIFGQTSQKDEVDTTTTTETVQNENAEITTDYAEKVTGNKLQTVKYLSANDGDTFSVELDGEKKKVRLLMVDTPEMNYDKGKPMLYAEQAKEYTVNVLEHANSIQLLFDKGPQTDNYSRLLAYVYVDGVLLQEKLLKEGLAAVRYVNKPNNSLESELRNIQKQAEKEKINIWSVDGYFSNNHFNEDVEK